MHLSIQNKDHEVAITSEPPDIPQIEAPSKDGVWASAEEYFFGVDGCRPSSRYRVAVKQGDRLRASCVLMAGGGSSGVHAHSAFARDEHCFVAVGDSVCALELPTLRLIWHTRADSATCFGVYDAPLYASIISHGELEIARLNYAGQLVWSVGGRDIFSEGFTLYEHHAEAVDFHGTRYRFELETGHSQIIGKGGPRW